MDNQGSTQKPKIKFMFRIGMLLSVILSVLLVGLLAYLYRYGSLDVVRTRNDRKFTQVNSVVREETERESAHLGVVTQYRFSLEQIPHDTHLGFYTYHQYVDVYVDGVMVYSMRPMKTGSFIKTVGCNWVMIPLYREDAGREILVELLPVYENARHWQTTFLVGSEFEMYVYQLSQNFAQLSLSGVVILCGVVLICVAGWWLFRKKNSAGLVALGFAALALGIWRLLDTVFSPFMMPDNPIFLYYLSMSMLMLTAIPLADSLRNRDNWFSTVSYGTFGILAIVVFLAQILLQIAGILDFRESLTASHVIFVIGAAIVIVHAIGDLQSKDQYLDSKRKRIIPLIFVLGICADLYRFYIKGDSGRLLFTLSAFAVYIIFTGLDFIASYSEREKILMEQEKQLILNRISVLMNQIRSHFVFNILNAISGMCKYDPEKADETVVCFSRYLRTNIDIMQEDTPVTFQAALRHVEDYIILEQIRFGDQIRFETDITVDQFRIPPLILQPVVENAIRHGLNSKAGGTVTLRTRQEGEWIRILVEDDGVGFDPDELRDSQSVGLKNVRFRLEHMVNGRLEIHSAPGVGTSVSILIPGGSDN